MGPQVRCCRPIRTLYLGGGEKHLHIDDWHNTNANFCFAFAAGHIQLVFVLFLKSMM